MGLSTTLNLVSVLRGPSLPSIVSILPAPPICLWQNTSTIACLSASLPLFLFFSFERGSLSGVQASLQFSASSCLECGLDKYARAAALTFASSQCLSSSSSYSLSFYFHPSSLYFHLPPVLWQCGGPLLPVLEAGGCCGCLRADPPFYNLADTRVYSVQYKEVAGSASLDRVQGWLCPGTAQASTFHCEPGTQ